MLNFNSNSGHWKLPFIAVQQIKYKDLARAKSEALDNIYSLFEQNIKSCNLSGEGNAGER